MARKTARITIAAEGRDKGKTFVLNELPADQAERWAIRALLAMLQSGADIAPDMIQGGMSSLAAIGLHSLPGVSWDLAEPLLEEMWTCVAYEHARGAPLQDIFPGLNSQIEEVATRLALRLAVIELHLGFFVPESSPISGLEPGENAESNTPTFLGSLLIWYRRVLRR